MFYFCLILCKVLSRARRWLSRADVTDEEGETERAWLALSPSRPAMQPRGTLAQEPLHSTLSTTTFQDVQDAGMPA